jgi:uncharacterized membrane protein
MSLFFTIKFIHIVAVSMMLGATLCNGLLHLSAMKSNSTHAASGTLNHVMKINQFIMAPSFFLLVASGLLMASHLMISFGTFWLWVSLLLTFILVIEFIGGYFIEKRMHQLCSHSISKPITPLPKQYLKMVKTAAPIGSSATLFSFIIIYLMIAKPA